MVSRIDKTLIILIDFKHLHHLKNLFDLHSGFLRGAKFQSI